MRSDDAEKGDCLAVADFGVHGDDWQEITAPVSLNGIHALYLVYHGKGSVCLKEIEFM